MTVDSVTACMAVDTSGGVNDFSKCGELKNVVCQYSTIITGYSPSRILSSVTRLQCDQKNRQKSLKEPKNDYTRTMIELFKNCLRMWKIWANKLLPKALKSCPKSNKSPKSHCQIGQSYKQFTLANYDSRVVIQTIFQSVHLKSPTLRAQNFYKIGHF